MHIIPLQATAVSTRLCSFRQRAMGTEERRELDETQSTRLRCVGQKTCATTRKIGEPPFKWKEPQLRLGCLYQCELAMDFAHDLGVAKKSFREI
jgi:hypothetical protein